METSIYPNSVSKIKTGDKYQVKDPLTDEWSDTKEVYGMSNCTKIYLQYLINRKGIRIIKNNKE